MSEPTGRVVFGSEKAKKIIENDKHLARVIEENKPSIENQEKKIAVQEERVLEIYDEIEHLQYEHMKAENELIDMRTELEELETGAMYG